MSRVSSRLALLTVELLIVALLCGLAFGQELHLKSRDIYTGPVAAGRARVRPGRPSGSVRAGSIHQIVQFDRSPGVEDIETLLGAGFQLVAAIPDNALLVTGPGAVRPALAGVKWLGTLEARDKLSPALDQARKTILAIVEFHADVDAGVQQSIAAAEGVTFERPAALLPYHAIVSASARKLGALASHDEVAYIFPADPALLAQESPGNALMQCAGMLTLAGPIAQYANIVHGWDLDPDGVAHLGYAFGTLTSKLPVATVESEILRAMNAWSAVASVTFQQSPTPAAARTVLVEFASGYHGDSYPFDATGDFIAHTFYPVPVNSESIAGDVHLNAVENWHAGGDVDVYTVALHELGHAIGLGHSDNPGDVMYPYYRRGMTLSANDIGAAQALYGAPAHSSISSAPMPATPVATIPLSLTLNPILPPGQAAETPIAGTVSGGVPPLALQYQTDRGYSGSLSSENAGTWSVAAVPLVTGTNTLTVTAFDSAHQSASQSAVVTRAAAPAAPGATPLKVFITSPISAVTTVESAVISLGGTSSGGAGVTQVTWQTSTGKSGTAVGTDRWLASNIPLLTGTNTIVVRAFDATGASAWASVVAVRP